MKKTKEINPFSIVKFAAVVSALSLSTTAIAGEAAISLGSQGITVEKDTLGRITFSYPTLLTKSKTELAATDATVTGDSADVEYPDGARAHVEILKGQIRIDFIDVPGDVANTKMAATLGIGNLMGGKWAIGGKSGTFPVEQPKNPFLYKGDADKFELTSPAGDSLALKLPGTGWQQLQDNREWGTRTYSWFFKLYFDKAKPHYTILIDDLAD